MSFWDILDIFANLSLIGGKESRTRPRKIYILFYILLLPGVFWFLFELKSILTLPSPLLFFGLTTVTGLALTIATIILIYKLDMIDRIGKRDLLAILIPVVLLTISMASLICRSF